MGGAEGQDPDHALDDVGRLGGDRRHSGPGGLLLEGRDSVADVQLAARARTMLYAVGLATAAMTAFYMWRLMNLTFYGKSRVKPEVAAHVHESPRVDDRAADAAGGRQRAGRLARHAQAVESAASTSAAFEAGWSRSFASAARRRRRTKASISASHRVDADGRFGGDRDHRRSWWRATSTTTSPRFPIRIGEVAQAAARPALQQVVSSTRSTTSCSSTAWARAADCCSARSTAMWWMAASTARAG